MNATFVKNKCIFLTILLQQKFALVMSFSSFRTGAGLRPKKCGAGAGWDGLRGGCGQNFSNSCGCEHNFHPRRTLKRIHIT